MYCISVSHKHTPANIRAYFAFTEEEEKQFIRKLIAQKIVNGCVILSTCNRSEIYFTKENEKDEDIVNLVEQELISFKKISGDLLLSHLMVYDENTSIRHLYRVCCGMDSMVLGEVEILHQVKAAYMLAKQLEATDGEMNVIFQGALNHAKTVTNETNITRLPVSIGTLTARAVIDFCKSQGNGFHVLVVGARGKIGNIVVRDLADFGVDEIEIIGTSRNHKAINAEFANVEHVKLVDYDKRYEYVAWADVVISATSSPHYTFTAKKVEECILGSKEDGCSNAQGSLEDIEKKSVKQRLFIDLAVPRDMDIKIGRLASCELKDIDYFKELAADNNLAKISEMKKAEWLLEDKIEEVSKVIAFQNFRKKYEERMNVLSEKDANWLLYKLKDSLDSKAFEQVLQVVEKEFGE